MSNDSATKRSGRRARRRAAKKQNLRALRQVGQQQEQSKDSQVSFGRSWEAYAAASGLLRFDNYADMARANQPSSSRDTGFAAQISHDSQARNKKTQPTSPSIKEESESDSERVLRDIPTEFGCPGPRDSRFHNLVRPIKPTPVSSAGRALEDVLLDHPKKRFEGIHEKSLEDAAQAILRVTKEATLQWVYKWCPGMKFTIIDSIRPMNYVEEEAGHNLFMVPSEAMDIKGTGTTLGQLYRNCCRAHKKHSKPQVAGVVDIANHCVILCRVLKYDKHATLIEELAEAIRWLDIGLGCKSLEIQRAASLKISRNVTGRPKVKKAKEQEILDEALSDFHIHRMEYSNELLQHVKKLLVSTYPTELKKRLAANSSAPVPVPKPKAVEISN